MVQALVYVLLFLALPPRFSYLRIALFASGHQVWVENYFRPSHFPGPRALCSVLGLGVERESWVNGWKKERLLNVFAPSGLCFEVLSFHRFTVPQLRRFKFKNAFHKGFVFGCKTVPYSSYPYHECEPSFSITRKEKISLKMTHTSTAKQKPSVAYTKLGGER
jgi:hypothetical protein